MKRSALALLGLLALPLTAMAQDRSLLAGEPPPERLPQSRFSLTPYVGARVPFTTGDVVLVDDDDNVFRMAYQRGGAPMAGLDFTAHMVGPVHFLGGAAFSPSRQDVLRVESLSGDSVTEVSTSGPSFWFAKAGVQVRLADPTPDNRRFHPSALVTVAPAMIWTNWDDVDGFPAEANSSSNHFAVNMGVDAAARIGSSDRWSFSLGLQDYLVFWDTDSLRPRDATIGQLLVGSPVAVDYDYSSSNILTLRLGVSYRFR